MTKKQLKETLKHDTKAIDKPQMSLLNQIKDIRSFFKKSIGSNDSKLDSMDKQEHTIAPAGVLSEQRAQNTTKVVGALRSWLVIDILQIQST